MKQVMDDQLTIDNLIACLEKPVSRLKRNLDEETRPNHDDSRIRQICDFETSLQEWLMRLDRIDSANVEKDLIRSKKLRETLVNYREQVRSEVPSSKLTNGEWVGCLVRHINRFWESVSAL